MAVARNLGDKVLEKRKAGAVEVEIAVRDLLATNHEKVWIIRSWQFSYSALRVF